MPRCSSNWACRLTQWQPSTWGTGIQIQGLMLSKHTFHPQSHLQSLILFSMESLNSRTPVLVQTATSHSCLSYFGYTITTEFSGSPSLPVSPTPSLCPAPGLLYRCVTPGDVPCQEPHQLRTPISSSKAIRHHILQELIHLLLCPSTPKPHLQSSVPSVSKTPVTYKSCHSWVWQVLGLPPTRPECSMYFSVLYLPWACILLGFPIACRTPVTSESVTPSLISSQKLQHVLNIHSPPP